MTSRASAREITTTLAFERTRIAYDRTMMAWIRTATSLITFGFSVYKFFQLEMRGAPVHGSALGPREFGLVLIGVGLLSLWLGKAEHTRDLRGLREQYPEMPASTTGKVALVIGLVGLFASLLVLLRA